MAIQQVDVKADEYIIGETYALFAYAGDSATEGIQFLNDRWRAGWEYIEGMSTPRPKGQKFTWVLFKYRAK